MGFTDEVGIGGGKPILKFNKEARYVKRGSDEAMNDQAFVAKIREARAGYIKFNGNDQPERRLGAIFPKDEAPSRSSLGDTDKSKWSKGRFGDEPEDPWTAVIEIPLQHRETGEEYLFAAQIQDSYRRCDGFPLTSQARAGGLRPRHPPWRRQLQVPLRANQEAGAEYRRQGAKQRCCCWRGEPPFNDELEF